MLTFNFNPFPQLETDRLILREHTMSDVRDLFKLRTNDEVHRYMNRPKDTFEKVEEITRKIMDNAAKNEGIMWAICLKNDPTLIGNIGFWQTTPEHHRAEIGYILHPSHWKKGIMSEAMATALKYGFENMKLHSVEGHVNPNNTASIRVLEKHGFVREAYFREDYFFDGKFFDSAVYCLLASDYFGGTK